MSKFKSKGSSTPEVHSARSKLDGLLQTLVDKKDDSPTIKEEPLSDKETEPSGSSPNTPTKRSASSSGKSSRKRRKMCSKEEIGGMEMGQYHHTYVMKLFDRSVDLAQFHEDTPLYPISRAWMRNQPHNRNLAPQNRSPSPDNDHQDSDDEEDNEEDNGRHIQRLPSPIPIKMEPGTDLHDIRIPSPVIQPTRTLDINADPDLAPAPEQLLLNHMARWKQVRQKWKDSARVNEVRYMNSLKLLRDMFDQQVKDQ